MKKMGRNIYRCIICEDWSYGIIEGCFKKHTQKK